MSHRQALVLAGQPDGPAQRADLGAVAHVFRLVWPAAEIEVLSMPSGIAVDVTLDRLPHRILLAPELAAGDTGMRLVRAIFKRRVPETLAGASQAQTLMLADPAGPSAQA